MTEPPSQVSGKRLFAEGIAIVASILLALAVDTAWDARSDRRQEQDELDRLSSELTSNLEQFRAWIAGHESQLAHSDSLLALLEEAPPNRAVRVKNGFLLSLLFAPIWQPETAVLDALIASGRLSLITDRGVREAIANLSSRFSDLELTTGLRTRSHYMDQVLPYLTRQGDITSLIAERQVDLDVIRQTGGFPWTLARGETVLTNTFELRNLVAQQHLWSSEALRSLEQTVTDLEAALERVEEARVDE